MEIRDIIRALVTGSVMLAVFGLGLKATMRHPISLLRTPWLFRSILAMNVIMPIFAAGISALLDIYRPVQIALVSAMVSRSSRSCLRDTKLVATNCMCMDCSQLRSILAVFLLPFVRESGRTLFWG